MTQESPRPEDWGSKATALFAELMRIEHVDLVFRKEDGTEALVTQTAREFMARALEHYGESRSEGFMPSDVAWVREDE